MAFGATRMSLLLIYLLAACVQAQGVAVASTLKSLREESCDDCHMSLIETIPIGMEENDNLRHMSTFDGWKQLVEIAESRIEIASYYWTLNDQEYPHETSKQGKEILALLKDAGTRRGIDIRITKDLDSSNFPNIDTKELVAAGAAVVRDVNFTQLLGSGVLHTKMWVVDRKHVYVGSSNFDWRALTHVKEIGLLAMNCSCLGEDFGKTFDVYWELGNRTSLPGEWGPEYEPMNNKDVPLEVISDDTTYDTYIASSPPQFCPSNRTTDLDAIYDVIDKAEEFINIAVMDYSPMMLYTSPLKFWPDLEIRLKQAAIDRGVKVKLLTAQWSQTKPNARKFLKALESFHNTYEWVDIQVKMFEVESTEDQKLIPFARVNHNKYVVTEKSAYIGTSNWSGDYFVYSGGVSIVITPTANATTRAEEDVRKQLENVFERDWYSIYAHELSYYETGGSVATTFTMLNWLVLFGVVVAGFYQRML